MSTPQPGQGIPASTTEVLAATIASAVERQLTQYVAAMAQQVDAARDAATHTRDELRAEFHAAHLALQTALEGKLAEFSGHQTSRLHALEAALVSGGSGGGGSVDTGELVALREHMDV